MALFRRRRSADSDSAAAVEEFWAHWADVRTDLAASVDAGTPVPEDAARQLTERVRQIHPALTWEVSRAPRSALRGLEDLRLDDDARELLARMDDLEGTVPASPADDPEYALVLSAGADDAARVLAERWSRSAPAEAAWRFLPARPADHDRLSKPVNWDGNELDLGHATVALRVNQKLGKIEVSVYHPDFMFVPEDVRSGVADLVVMLALGEDDVVRWIGSVTPLVEKPLDPLPPTSMPSVVQQLSGTLGSGGWVTLQGRIPLRGTIQIAVRHPLHRRDFPAFTLYVQVTVHYAETDSDRLPTGSSAAALESFTLGLRDLLGEDGALLAQQTVGGQRQFHFYLDPDSGVYATLEKAVREWPEGRTQINSLLDPEWDTIDQISRPVRRQLGQ
ncbi:DUF695 domain-containing protein [Marinitenerispora sediminis]|uniref:DUF695 domain-containing protein n=1 Tax=Marinitenerispora sediminis TaxID=1931232 RepID=A0A368T3Z7_9ACTN|nr:DUF695 domain-containing protein [Marinitenerispora sediminis]RCV51245.1 DUF695 domain-containing protein [Marinitenerispora sediminis]RCV55773.1 DUF695 domain-containing protein [Marinitenerispora sediminis]RCV57534.1 DUF695 domain-containing protein [Marinitenerispora sediminis]